MLIKHEKCVWTLSSAGRASALQAEGHRFEPYSAHHFLLCGQVVQLVRMPACHAGGHGFEPRLGRQLFCFVVGIVKWLRHRIVIPTCVGSIPTTHPICTLGYRQVVRQWILIPSCAGSNPATLANKKHCIKSTAYSELV